MDKMRIHEMLECLTEVALNEIKTKGAHNVDTEEMGEVIDMIKDLAEAEKCAWEKCYYKSIVEAMADEEKYEQSLLKEMIDKYGEADGRLGYDRWRTSRGRFAPKGTGHETSMAMATGRHGFVDDRDPWPNPPYYDDPRMWKNGQWMESMGYPVDDRNSARSTDRRSSDGRDVQPSEHGRMGYSPDESRMDSTGKGLCYDEYDKARRHYRETNDASSKQEMSERAKKYVGEAMATMTDIFIEADPELQKKIKDDLFRLYRDFGGTK